VVDEADRHGEGKGTIAMASKRQETMHPIEAILAYCQAAGIRDIERLDGCCEATIDDRWWFAVNGHGEERRCSRGAPVPPYRFYVEFRGWPAALLLPTGEGEFVRGEAASAELFTAAVRAAIERLPPTGQRAAEAAQ